MQDFPDDDNGHALRNMERSGDDLSKSREMDFSLVFPSVEMAAKFVEKANSLGIEAVVEAEGAYEDLVDVNVKREMVPTHSGITEFEALLQQLAAPFDGENDGWGCFAVKA